GAVIAASVVFLPNGVLGTLLKRRASTRPGSGPTPVTALPAPATHPPSEPSSTTAGKGAM
ncbi:MAG: hypothetical protein ACJ79L_13320, partial [Anaeromyxobacteraceae bacterium]